MKLPVYKTILLVICMQTAFAGLAQQMRSELLVKSFLGSEGWTISFVKDTASLPLFERKQEGLWKFTSTVQPSQQVSFMIFPCTTKKEEEYLAKKTSQYISLSSCTWHRFKNNAYNFDSFVKDGYYFLMQMCPCSSYSNTHCAKLAKQINDWSVK